MVKLNLLHEKWVQGRLTLEKRKGHTFAKLLISAVPGSIESDVNSVEVDLELRRCKCSDLCRILTALSEPSDSIRILVVMFRVFC